MNSTKININTLYRLIGYGYIENPSSCDNADVEISYDELVDVDSSKVLFYSSINNICAYDKNVVPFLKSLYGVPAGLITVADASCQKSLSDQVSDDIIIDEYPVIRRGLYYSLVWSIKADENYNAVVDYLSWFLSHNDSVFKSLVAEIYSSKGLPEKSSGGAINHSRYEYKALWFGQFLASRFFADNNDKMDDDHKKWYITARDGKPDDIVPKRYKPYHEMILAYLIAAKVSIQTNDNYYELVKEVVASMVSNKESVGLVVRLAMFFIGIYQKQALQYYFISKSHLLMKCADRVAYSIYKSKNIIEATEIRNAVDELLNIEPLQNCVDYYKMKNPAIRNYVISDTIDDTKSENIIYLLNKQAPDTYNRICGVLASSFKTIKDVMSDYTFVFDKELAKLFKKQENISCILPKEEGMIEKISYFFKNLEGCNKTSTKVYDIKNYSFDAPKPILPIADFNIDANQLQSFPVAKPIETKVLVLHVNSEKMLTMFTRRLIEVMYDRSKIELVMAVYHQLKQEPRNAVKSITKGRKKAEESGLLASNEEKSAKYDINEMNVAKLQRELEQIYPQSVVKVICKQAPQPIWEAVKVGQSTLAYYDLRDIQVLDLRSEQPVDEPNDFILRMIRNIVVYEPNMRFMFMNLS